MTLHAQIVADYGREDEPDWRNVHWPAHMRALTVDSRRVHVTALGSAVGRPILLVHGLGGSWRTWLPTLPRLATTRRVLAADLPGFGRSQMPLAPISIAGYVNALERVCDLFELQAPLIAGHGLGAVVAAELAVRHPERVGALAVIAASWPRAGELQTRAAQLAFTLADRLVARPRAKHLALAAAIRHPSRIAPDLLAQLGAGLRAPGAQAALAALLEHKPARLHEIAIPTLIVRGANDRIAPAAGSQRLAAEIEHAQRETLVDCGHLPMVERPRRFNELLAKLADQY